MHEWESESETDEEHRFKPLRAEADWLKEKDDQTRVMMSVLRLTGQ